jgi:hypothetical protein
MKNMKKNTMMMLALVAMTAGVAVNAETPAAAAPAKAQVAAPAAADAAKLSTDEQAFAAKLNDQNRKSFSEKLSADQRKSAMTAVKNGANADEAVSKLVAAKEMKDTPAVANAEKATAEKTAPAAK